MHEFEVIKQLGSGSFGRVLKVRRKQDKSTFAMKTIKMMQLNAKQKDNALNEVRLLASIDSPNVIKYKGAFFQQCGSILSIVMQFADGGDLAGYVEKKVKNNQRFQENFIWKVAFDILKGLEFLHSSNIIHRDIKSANIFFVNGVAKLGDLNVSKVMEGDFATTQTGTPYYTSPQIWNGKKYSANCDIWSLGCVLFELCCLRPPFMANDFPGLMKLVTKGYHDPIPSKYSKKLAFLIQRCLTVNHQKRPSAAQLLKTDVFAMLHNPRAQQGQIQLLDTIRCPRALNLLNKQLPDSQYKQKKPKTLKIIAEESNNQRDYQNRHGSIKKIGSERNIRGLSIDRAKYQNNHYNQQPVQSNVHCIQNQYNKMNPQNIVMNSPGGIVKLPKINSYKLLI